MGELSLLRLYILRATYLLLAVGLASMIGPGLFNHPANLEHMRGVVRALLAAVGLLAVVGVRYPVRMLPLLLFELVWKAIWIIAFGLPAWRAGLLEAGMRETWFETWFGVVLCVVAIPWPYVLRNYLTRPGDRWGRRGTAVIQESVAR